MIGGISQRMLKERIGRAQRLPNRRHRAEFAAMSQSFGSGELRVGRRGLKALSVRRRSLLFARSRIRATSAATSGSESFNRARSVSDDSRQRHPTLSRKRHSGAAARRDERDGIPPRA
jgi:hypothetical protein